MATAEPLAAADGLRITRDAAARRDVLRRLAGPDEDERPRLRDPAALPPLARGSDGRRPGRRVAVRGVGAGASPRSTTCAPATNRATSWSCRTRRCCGWCSAGCSTSSSAATANVSTGRPARSACSSSARATPPPAASRTNATLPQLLPETGRDLVGEQDAGWGQLDVALVDDRASRRRRRARLRASRPTMGSTPWRARWAARSIPAAVRSPSQTASFSRSAAVRRSTCRGVAVAQVDVGRARVRKPPAAAVGQRPERRRRRARPPGTGRATSRAGCGATVDPAPRVAGDLVGLEPGGGERGARVLEHRGDRLVVGTRQPPGARQRAERGPALDGQRVRRHVLGREADRQRRRRAASRRTTARARRTSDRSTGCRTPPRAPPARRRARPPRRGCARARAAADRRTPARRSTAG